MESDIESTYDPDYERIKRVAENGAANVWMDRAKKAHAAFEDPRPEEARF